jgi:phosphoribosylformimino-5-aminoimidazole carboxamide ribotide isomerase
MVIVPGGAGVKPLMPLRVIPVLDVKGGRAVRAIGGDRDHYRPLSTRLHPGCDPLAVAQAYRDVFDFRELYLADLDAIAGMPPSEALYRSIRTLGVDLWVDAGIRDRTSLGPLLAAEVGTLVVGLETIRGPDALEAIGALVPPARLVFSVDLHEGRPLVGGSPWGTTDPLALARSVVARGIRRLLLLDLARVGTGRGTGLLDLLAHLRGDGADLEIAVGGGVADRDDVEQLASGGASAVLIGSALHDGRIGPDDLH